jgi:phosphatidylglycerophosphatase A
MPQTASDARPPRSAAFWLATWFGSGLLPKAPGTWGTIASLFLWAPMVMLETPWWARLLTSLAIFAIGVPVSTKVAKEVGKDDPKEVVIDEVAGQGLAYVLAAPTVTSLVVGFALFRFFDIKKPWPVGWADRNLHEGTGIMVDDMLAGAWALGLLFALERYGLPALGVTPW